MPTLTSKRIKNPLFKKRSLKKINSTIKLIAILPIYFGCLKKVESWNIRMHRTLKFCIIKERACSQTLIRARMRYESKVPGREDHLQEISKLNNRFKENLVQMSLTFTIWRNRHHRLNLHPTIPLLLKTSAMLLLTRAHSTNYLSKFRKKMYRIKSECKDTRSSSNLPSTIILKWEIRSYLSEVIYMNMEQLWKCTVKHIINKYLGRY